MLYVNVLHYINSNHSIVLCMYIYIYMHIATSLLRGLSHVLYDTLVLLYYTSVAFACRTLVCCIIHVII